MPATRRDFILTRSGTTATINVVDWQGEEIYVYRADEYNQNFVLVNTFVDDNFTDTGLDPELTYKYYIRPTDLERSLSIIEDNTDQEPPFYVVEAVGNTTFTADSYTAPVTWGADIDVDIITVGNLQQGARSIGKYTK